MSEKYLLFVPQNGFNDCCTHIEKTISYCVSTNRVLLLDFTRSLYGINFSDYFYTRSSRCKIIYDTNEIINILTALRKSGRLSVYPKHIDFDVIRYLEGTQSVAKFRWEGKTNYTHSYRGKGFELPSDSNETLIFHCAGTGGDGYQFFKTLGLRDNVKMAIKEKVHKLGQDYLCIQVRNTDIKSNFQGLYDENKTLIDGFERVYICTDDRKVYEFFKSKLKNVVCFTTFPPPSQAGKNLHESKGVSSSQRMLDLLVDILIATNSKTILSNSKGGFIYLLRSCHQNKSHVLKMLE